MDILVLMKLPHFVFPLLALAVAANAQPLKEVDLASETVWTLSIDGKPETHPIKVPFGGWNSNRQSPQISEVTDVMDHVVYSRTIQIPEEAKGQVTKLVFGCVNYGAEVFLDGKLIGRHEGPFTSFEVDLTGRVEPLKSYRLEVKAYTLNHYNDSQNRELVAQGKMKMEDALRKGKISVPTGFVYINGLSSLGYGIGRFVKLQVLPTLYIKDLFVRPLVSGNSLSYDIWIENRGNAARTVTLKSSLDSWNKSAWPYPQIPDTVITVAAGQTLKASIGPVAWKLGPASYWWPNIPFREDYVATLHFLNVSLNESGKAIGQRSQRFGFVEHAEGPYYYTINGVRVNLPSDATAITQCGIYDGYAESPAFRPPTGPNTGCPETWKRFMRLGIRANRTHQEPPTEYMMEAADEAGFVIIPESAIRGSYLPASRNPKEPSYATHLEEMIVAARNHPSVARYSLSNEFGAPPEFIDFAAPHDSTRPLVYESKSHDVSTRVETVRGHAYTTAHYCTWPRPARKIFAMGEYAWSTDGLADYINQGRDMRLNDVCYFSGWSWLNYWPNFLEGHNHDTFAWKQNNHPDRKGMGPTAGIRRFPITSRSR
jgi:beta-galactosidase/beta-glucuronidase